MIIKSYLAENDKQLFNNDLLLFYGENIGLIQDFKNKIKSKFKKSQVYNLNQKDILQNEQNFYNELFNESLFDEYKVFIIDQCDDKITKIIEKNVTDLEKRKIFIFSEILQKNSKLRNFFEKSRQYGVIACYEDNEISLKKIIFNKLSGYKNLNTDVVNMILESCNLDRAKLNNELEKIIILFEKKEIEKNQLEELLNIREDDKFSNLRDKAINGDLISTNKILNNIYIENEKIIFYITVLNQRLNRIKDVILGSNNRESINKIKPPLFWKDKPIFEEQLKKCDIKKINLALDNTFQLEIIIKTNSAFNKDILVKKTIVDICNLANAS